MVEPRKSKARKSLTSTLKPPVIIGWRESVSLPSLGLSCVHAKIDTGAKTSALHVTHLHKYSVDGLSRVSFTSYDLRNGKHVPIKCDALVKDERMVSDSSGNRQLRIVIGSELTLGELSWPIEITLTDRSKMRYQMLVGRGAIQRGMLVNIKKSYLMSHK